MAHCKNKGCTGHARRGQFFCYDCYQAWMHGGDDAVAARLEEMTKHTAELAELRAFKGRVFDAVLPDPIIDGQVRTRARTEKALFDTIRSGHYVLAKLRKEWYNSPDFRQQVVPTQGTNVRAERAQRMVDWYHAQLDKANKPSYGGARCSDCGTACYLSQRGCPKAPHGPQCYGLVGYPAVPVKLCKHPSAKTTDESAALRLRVAELEGRLSLYWKREAKQGASTCFSIVLATVAVLTGIVAYFTK